MFMGCCEFSDLRLVENGFSDGLTLDSQNSQVFRVTQTFETTRNQESAGVVQTFENWKLRAYVSIVGGFGVSEKGFALVALLFVVFLLCLLMVCVGVLLCVLFRNFWGVHCIVNEAGCLYVAMTET